MIREYKYTVNQNIHIQNNLMEKYRDTISFRITNEKGAYCYVPERIIYLSS